MTSSVTHIIPCLHKSAFYLPQANLKQYLIHFCCSISKAKYVGAIKKRTQFISPNFPNVWSKIEWINSVQLISLPVFLGWDRQTALSKFPNKFHSWSQSRNTTCSWTSGLDWMEEMQDYAKHIAWWMLSIFWIVFAR